MTVGPPLDSSILVAASPINLVSSLPIILAICSSGVKLPKTSLPKERDLTSLMKVLTTLKLTSASSNAKRTSRSASEMFFSVSFP